MAQTTTETTLVTTRQPSERLQGLIDSCATGFQKLGKTIELTLELGRSEGFTDRQIGNLIRQKMLQAGLDSSTIRRHLPASAKRTYISNKNSNLSSNLNSRKLHDLELELQPQDYQTKDLTKYTKKFLIEIIRYLESISPNTKTKTRVGIGIGIGVKPITSSNSSNKHLPNDKIQMIKDMRKKGMSSRQIFAATGIARTTITRYWNS